MQFLNIAIVIFTLSIFLAIIGLAELASYAAIASGVLASIFVVTTLWGRFVLKR